MRPEGDAMSADRQAIEAAADLKVSLPASLEPWAGLITDALQGVCKGASANGLKLDSLRLIAVVIDMRAAALEWQRELGEPESGVSDTPHGVVAGKTITWMRRPGDPVPCAVVIFNAELLPALLDRSGPALVALIHELAHVHEQAMALNAGHGAPPGYTRDIPALRRCIASLIWEEYFAERFAASWIAEDDFDVANWTLLVQEKHEHINALRSEFYRTRDVQVFWDTAVTQIADAGQAIGRALGRFASRPELQAQFVEGLSIGPRWQRLARAMVGILDELYAGALDASPAAGVKLAPLMADLWEEHGVRWEEHVGANCRIAIANRDDTLV